MNEQIIELWAQAVDTVMPETYVSPSWAQIEKIKAEFATLIVKECATVVENSKWNLPRGHKAIDQANLVKQHFGVTE